MLESATMLVLRDDGISLELLATQTAASLLVACQGRLPNSPDTPLLPDATQDCLRGYGIGQDSSDYLNALQTQASLLYDIVQICVKARDHRYLLPELPARRLIADALAAYQACKTHYHDHFVAEKVGQGDDRYRDWGRDTDFVRKDWSDLNAKFLAQLEPAEATV
jgi:hypothetical protein